MCGVNLSGLKLLGRMSVMHALASHRDGAAALHKPRSTVSSCKSADGSAGIKPQASLFSYFIIDNLNENHYHS